MTDVAPEGKTDIEVPEEFSVHGLHIYRTAVEYRRHDEDEEGVSWALSPALSDVHDLGIIGDLTIRSARMFAGAQVLCFIQLPWRETAITDEEWPLADAVVTRVASGLTHAMYDFAALAMRGNAAGFSSALRVPRQTPDYTLVLAGDSETSEGFRRELHHDDE